MEAELQGTSRTAGCSRGSLDTLLHDPSDRLISWLQLEHKTDQDPFLCHFTLLAEGELQENWVYSNKRWRKGIKEAKETKVGKQMDKKSRITEHDPANQYR